MDLMPTVVVLPCLDEERTLLTTCQSLGFARGGSTQEPDVYLVIVDNDSHDRTLAVAEAVREASALGSVRIVRELESGYVPPRRTGVSHAAAVAAKAGWSDTLIIQADADTTYSKGYVRCMRAASKAGRGAFLEGTAEFPVAFRHQFPDYVALAAEVDARVHAELRVPAASELLCTDSVCAYRLSDYETWGGHLREYAGHGEEILAETTRLYMRSLVEGSRKITVLDALAHPSARKAEQRPGEEFATAGFPRGAEWRTRWRRRYPKGAGAAGVPLARLDPHELDEAIQMRTRHFVALFGLLPIHTFRALGRDAATGCHPLLRAAADALPRRDAQDLKAGPGAFIEDVLAVADDSDYWQTPL